MAIYLLYNNENLINISLVAFEKQESKGIVSTQCSLDPYSKLK